MKNKKVIIGAVLIMVLAGLAFWARNYMAIDSCLDSGGRWNYDQKICEH